MTSPYEKLQLENIALRAKIEDTEGIAIAIAGGQRHWNLLFDLTKDGYRKDALAVQKYLKD